MAIIQTHVHTNESQFKLNQQNMAELVDKLHSHVHHLLQGGGEPLLHDKKKKGNSPSGKELTRYWIPEVPFLKSDSLQLGRFMMKRSLALVSLPGLVESKGLSAW